MHWVDFIAYTSAVIGATIVQVGYILMKKGMHAVENSGLNGGKKKVGFFTWQWISGFLLLATGSIINVCVLPFCDLVVYSSISALTILINNVLSVIILKEKIEWRYDLPALVLIIGGSLTIVFLSNYDETVYTPELINELLWSTTTLVCAIVALLLTIGTIIQYCWHLSKLAQFNSRAN